MRITIPAHAANGDLPRARNHPNASLKHLSKSQIPRRSRTKLVPADAGSPSKEQAAWTSKLLRFCHRAAWSLPV